MKFLIPTHLQSIYHLDMDKSESDFLTGRIKCTCGCVSFRMVHNNDEDREHSLMLKLICTDCEKEWLLLDEATQGYGGFVCHDGETAPESKLHDYVCPTCGKNHAAVQVEIEPEDYEQFQEEIVEEYPDEFKPSDFVDAFGWITVSLHCTECGTRENGWVDLELS